MHAPILGRLTTHVIGDLGDPLLQAWQVAWIGHALVHQPFGLFDANIFWPLEDPLAFTDVLLGYGAVGLIGDGVGAALARYNLLVIFSHAFPAFGGYWLARESGFQARGSVVAGTIVAFTPWRVRQLTHLHVLASAGVPLSLALLVRGYRTRSAAWMLAGMVVATWQLSLGFTHGLVLGYLLAGAMSALLIVRLRRGSRIGTGRPLVGAVVGGIIFFGWAVIQAMPFVRVAAQHPGARRTWEAVEAYSPEAVHFLVPSAGSLAYGFANPVFGESMFRWWVRHGANSEVALFPGIVALALAVVGAGVLARRRPRLGAVLVLGTVGIVLVSLGSNGPFDGALYRSLFEAAPGWQALRTPGRLVTFATLALALLAAGAVDALSESVRARRATVWTTLLACFVLLEGWPAVPHPEVPAAPEPVFETPVLHLPMAVTQIPVDPLYTLWSVDGFYDLANGHGGFVPESYVDTLEAVMSFPDPTSVEFLRARGIKTVIVHPALPAGVLWAEARTRPVEPLGIGRNVRGGAIIFDIR